jgi:hypothetical protein
MQATFNLDAVPNGAAALRVMGMDSEDPASTPISISINNVQIYSGAAPFPNDDNSIETDNFGAYNFVFDSTALRAGQNTVTISTLVPGQMGGPPFFMLDAAEVLYPSP